ncbi:hypothetical protein ACKWTF_003341 [Chironomus riparius]
MELDWDLRRQSTLDEASEANKAENDKKDKEVKLRKIFEKVFCGDHIICQIKGRRKTGKSILAMEIIIQNLMNNPDNEALFINTYGNFNSRKFSDLCETYIKADDEKDVKETVIKLMKRLRVIHIENESNFHDYMSCLEAMILGFSKLSLIVIDSFSFYFHEAFVFEKVYEKPLTREMFLNYYLNIFDDLVKKYNISIIYTLPQHLVKQYTNSRDYVEGETEAKERKIYEHIKMTAINNSEHRFPIIADAAPKDAFKSNVKNRNQEKFVKDLSQPDPCSTKCLNTQFVHDIIPEIKINESPELGINEQEPIKTGQSSDNQSNIHEFRDINNESSDSLSDANSEKSGEGYKSDTGTTESSVASQKLSEKIIATMYRSTKPDVTLKLLNVSPNLFMMQITTENQQNHGVYFNITENGIIWEITPAEN